MPKSVRGVMHEYKHGELHSGSSTGPVVKSRKQAVAIALSEQRQQGKATPKRALHPALKAHGAKVKAAHAALSRSVPGFSKLPAAHRFAHVQRHIRNQGR